MESLKEQFLEGWSQRSQQEQVVLGVVALFVICGLLFLFVFEPIASAKEKQQKRLESNNRILTEVNSLASQIKARQSAGSNNGKKGSLAVIVDKSLQENGLNMQGFQPGKNNDARLRLSNIAYKPLAKWLHDLEYRHRVTVQDLSVSQSKTPGLLMVSVRLKQ